MDFTNASYLPPNTKLAWTTSTQQTGAEFRAEARTEALKEDEVFGRAGVRGFLNKSGMIPSIYFTTKSHDLRKSTFESWLDNYAEGKSHTFQSHSFQKHNILNKLLKIFYFLRNDIFLNFRG